MLREISWQLCQIDGCDNQAHWAYDGTAICHACMVVVAEWNSDNLEVYAPALLNDLERVVVGEQVDGVASWECTEGHLLKLKRMLRLLQDRSALAEWTIAQQPKALPQIIQWQPGDTCQAFVRDNWINATILEVGLHDIYWVSIETTTRSGQTFTAVWPYPLSVALLRPRPDEVQHG